MSDSLLLKAKINSETAKLPWSNLQRLFAQGKVFYVDSSLDLIETAFEIANNEQIKIDQYLQDKLIYRVNDDQAKNWYEQNQILWVSVIKPWVLVQEI